MRMRQHGLLPAILATTIVISHASAQTANTVYTGIAVNTVTCNNNPNPFVQYWPAKIEASKTGVVTLKFLQQSASSPGNAPVSLDGSGYVIEVIEPPGTSGTSNFFQYTFTTGSQRAALSGSGATLKLEPGTDPVSGLPNLGFQLTIPSSNCTFSFNGGAVAFQSGL